jgi:hypothetical protein
MSQKIELFIINYVYFGDELLKTTFSYIIIFFLRVMDFENCLISANTYSCKFLMNFLSSFLQPLVKFKSHLYYEEKDRVTESLKALKVLSGSKLIFFKNGMCQGVAFNDIYGGHYFPTLSIHKSATVSVNFGPNFKYSPSNMSFRGVSKKVIS